MPKTSIKAKAKSTKTGATKIDKKETSVRLNSYLENEISRLADMHGVSTFVFEQFTHFVIENYKKKEQTVKSPKVKPLTLAQIKTAIYQNFSVKNTTELKKSGAFKMATDGMDTLNLSVKDGWEKLYRKFIGIIPGEENQQGYGCINGINIFNYFKPWQVFDLNPQAATTEDIKSAYHRLSKIYHPDVHETGDAAIFERLNIMYKSISAKA
ncbi:J domain-containing protein [Merismopedia glauca]|uniref:Molecular chaperone DnaJ n=1 Tax=Merismopedia glauca CCAP 1448/3 TaxID=1296344 RepID=A0A2T1BZI4_9CYAN|nr:J domain-containing protein [Merismopedia glauca]PSB01411.1 molecular chaperone DnaJ [Merismopedia glauca CCAP 1448/3]